MDKYFLLFILFIVPSVYELNAQNQFFEDSLRANEAFNKGYELYRDDFFEKAIDSFKVSLELRINLFDEPNVLVGLTYNALGINYKNIGQYDKAIESFKKAETSYLFYGDKFLTQIANLYNNIGNVYKNKLDYNTSLAYYERGVNILLSLEETEISDIADIYYNIADIYKNIGEYEKSISIINEYSSNAYFDTKLYFLDLKAATYHLLNDTVKAEESYLTAINEAIKLYQEEYLSEIEVAYEYLNYSSFLVTIGNSAKAFKTLEKAYEIIHKTQQEEGQDLAQYYSVLGDYYALKKVESMAIDAFKRQKIVNLYEAIDSYRKGLKALNFEFDVATDTIPDIGRSLSLIQSLDFFKSIADTYVEIGEVYENKNQDLFIASLQNALDYYRVTSGIIQNARKQITSDESKIQLAELEQATFHKMINTAYQVFEFGGDKEMLDFAFKNAEKIKASTVFDQLSGELAKNELIPDSLLQLENNLNYAITRKNELVYNLKNEENPDSEKLSREESALFQLKKQRDEFNQYLENSYPEYYDLKYSDKLLGINEIQKRLKHNEVLIEYVLSENDSIIELYAFLVSTNKARFIHPKIDSSFIQATTNSFRFMSDSRYMFTKNDDAKEFCVNANYLYETLISPFENEIRDKKILIVPDGKLNYIAFDALIDELPDTTAQINFSKLGYLIKKNSINYSYSANLLYGFDKGNKTSGHRLLAFAPEYSEDTIIFNNKKLALMPLPGIQKEVELIAQEVNSRVFLGDEASELNFRLFSDDYDILHLAMHAFIDDADPAFSSLAFTQKYHANAENNGRLNTADIYNLDLNARLTVLSACNTGSGELKKGEGVMSLARGFLYAGCPSIVMTLWEVDDIAGTQIMGSFYKNLKKGRAVDEALRLAKLEYIEGVNSRMAHPHYWLGYVSIGDSSPLFRSYDYYFFGLLIIALLVVAIDQIIRLRKSRKKYS